MKNTAAVAVEPLETRIKAAIEIVKSSLAKNNFPSNKQLIEICADCRIGMVDSANEPHFVHEILETAVNFHFSDTESLKSLKEGIEREILARLEFLTKELPTQSWRGLEQVALQQFPTPPALAFVLGQILKPEAGKIALEPSAGTGSLAVWLKNAGCLTEVNEISARRKMLLELQDFDPHAVNAEFLDDLPPTRIKPDYILMNPPFSASGALAKKRDSNFRFRHVETALRRLNPGGWSLCSARMPVSKPTKAKIFGIALIVNIKFELS